MLRQLSNPVTTLQRPATFKSSIRTLSTTRPCHRAAPIDFPTPHLARVIRESARAKIAEIDRQVAEATTENSDLGVKANSVYTYDAFMPPPLPVPVSSLPLPDVLNERSLQHLQRSTHPLVDSFKRKHDYLRISLTEKCNLRCFYCMPEDGIDPLPNSNLMTDDEIIRLSRLFVRNGVRKIRLTGGEPTIRKNIVDLVGRLSELRPLGLEAIGMTTNGLALHRKLPDLIRNGLTHLNLSLDTLDPVKFEHITRRKGHQAVMQTLKTALDQSGTLSLRSIKINVVVIKGINDFEVLDFIEMTRNDELSVRFIEFMPFTGNNWNKGKLVPSSELLSIIRDRYPDAVKATDELNDTARSYTIPGFRGSFGFISSMSDHFCSTCNRLRITADGKIKVCLFDAEEISLRDYLRSGATDDQLARLIGFAVSNKKEKHVGMEDIDVIHNRPMIKIGGHKHNLPPLLSTITYPQPNRSLKHTVFPYTPNHPLPAQSFVSTRHHSTSSVSSSTQSALHVNGTTQSDPQPPSSSNITVVSASLSPPRLTHVDSSGRPSMVDVTSKSITKRTAIASGRIYLTKIAFDLVCPHLASSEQRALPPSPNHQTSNVAQHAFAKASRKGPVLPTAQIAGILAVKQTSSLIPLCHPLSLTHIQVDLIPEPERLSIQCQVTVSCEGKTGVEMEALMGVNGALLCVWDMVKAVAGREMKISDIMVTHKSGGKSGDFERTE